MTTYTPSKMQIETNLDAEGVRLGFPRLPNESAEDYSFRLKAEVLERSTGKNISTRSLLTRNVGLFSNGAFIVDLVRGEDDLPLAECPVIITKGGEIVFYSNYREDQISFRMKTRVEGNTVFISELIDLINSSGFFSAESINSELLWESVSSLRNGTSIKTKTLMAVKGQENFDLEATNIVMLKARNPFLLADAVEGVEDVDAVGKYYLNYRDGILTTYNGVLGEIEVEHSEFPFTYIHDPITVFEAFDESVDYVLKEAKLEEDEVEEVRYRLLTPTGNKIHRNLLQKVGNQWS